MSVTIANNSNATFCARISVLALVGMGIGADLALVGKDVIRFLFGSGWEQAGQIFSLFGPGIGVMLLYNTHGWIHLSIGRPERWFRWGLLEFVCTAGLFLLTLRWGPSGIAFAWTASYFLLMFPGFWYAGKPIGLGMGPVMAVIWKFFASSVGASVGTLLIFRALPYFATMVGLRGAFVRARFRFPWCFQHLSRWSDCTPQECKTAERDRRPHSRPVDRT